MKIRIQVGELKLTAMEARRYCLQYGERRVVAAISSFTAATFFGARTNRLAYMPECE
jgi:hypothetical protein